MKPYPAWKKIKETQVYRLWRKIKLVTFELRGGQFSNVASGYMGLDYLGLV